MEMCGFGVGALHTYGYEWDRGVGRTDGASRSEKLGRGGTDGELAKPLIVIQRVQIPPDQSRADRSVVSLAIHRATGGCRSVDNKEARP